MALIARHAGIDDLRACLFEGGPQRVTVGVRDLAGGQRFSGVAQLVAGRQHHHARSPNHADGRASRRRQHADHPRGHDPTPFRDDVAAAEIAAGATDAGTWLHRDAHFDLAITFDGILDAHHGIGAVGHRATGHDPQRGRGAN